MPAMRTLLLSLLLASSLASAAEPAAAAPSPFASLPADPAPPALVRNSHYWVSNEDQLELFHDAVKDKHGIYLGVGPEQNYLLAAWARADTLVLMDFDQAVVDLHRVHRVLFQAAEKPEDFLKMWRSESRAQVTQLIEAAYTDPAQRSGVMRAYTNARWAVEQRFKRVAAQMKKAGLTNVTSDAADYAHVRGLFLADKVFIVRGDLTVAGTVLAIGKAAAEAKQKMGVLYLSNAEGYFDFTPQFRDNMRALPLDASSVVVRTSGQRGVSHVKDTYYHYNTQSGASFLAWLADPSVKSVREMLTFAPDTGTVVGLSRLDLGPAEAREAKKQKAAPAPKAPKAPAPKEAAPAGKEAAP